MSTTSNFFAACTSLDEAKQLFKKLALENHPDRGGDEETMKKVNSDYAYIVRKLTTGGGFTESEINDAINLSEIYQNAINAIAGLSGLVIELVGDWIWVSGTTAIHKESLKAAGFFWASKKLMWYFRSETNKCKSFKSQSIETIKAKYGSVTINAKSKRQIA